MSKFDRLDEGKTFTTVTNPLDSGTLTTAKPITVTLDEISFFSLNPRRADNPKFEEIKESIRTIGLENPLTITKRPGEASYTLFNGGNTRLKALKELWNETGDYAFFEQHCRFVPYKSDSELVIRHMIENETRGDMLLIDKAMAAHRVKELHESETGEKLSSRKLADMLSAQGWQVAHKTASIFIFVAEQLAEQIPMALAAGMGRPKIESIRKTYHAVKKYTDERLSKIDVLSGEEAIKMYLSALADHDDAEFIESYPFDDLCDQLSALTEIDAARIRFEIQHIIEHGEVYVDDNPLAGVNELGQYEDEECHENQHETVAEKSVSTTTEAENTPEETDDDTPDSVLPPSEPVSEMERTTMLYREQIRYLRMTYEHVTAFIDETTEPPYFALAVSNLQELNIAVNKIRDVIVEADNPTEDELSKATQLVCIADLITALVQIKLFLLKDDPNRSLIWQDHFKNLQKIDSEFLAIMQCYRYGFISPATDVAARVFNEFNKLAQYSFQFNRLANQNNDR